jgi:phage-related protein
VGPWFGEKWTEAKAGFDTAKTWLGTFEGDFIPEPIKTAWGTLTAFFDSLWGGVVKAFQWAWGIIEPIISAVAAGVGKITGAFSTVSGLAGGAIQGVKNFFTGGGGEAPAAPGAVAAPADGGSLLQGAKRAGVAGGQQQTARVEGEVQTNIKIETVGDIKATATTRDRGMASSNVEVGRSMPGLAAG